LLAAEGSSRNLAIFDLFLLPIRHFNAILLHALGECLRPNRKEIPE
jgi:hypothetical protein